jgi:hypothetical protein
MKLVFNNESIELGSETVENILNDIVFQVADDREAFYLEVAKKGSRTMRALLANLSPMPKAVFDVLIENADSYLVGRLIANEDAAVHMTQDMVDDLVNSGDFYALVSFIAYEQNLRHLEGIDEKLEQLGQHHKLEIRCTVGNKKVPVHILDALPWTLTCPYDTLPVVTWDIKRK